MLDNFNLEALGGYEFDPAMAKQIALAAITILVTWVLAKVAKWVFARLVDRIGFLQNVSGSGESVGQSLSKIVGLLIWLFGLIAVLTIFQLTSVIEPVQTLLNNIMGFIPNLIGAGLIFFVGAMVARIVKQLIETTLSTVNFDKWANKGGVDDVTGNSKISGVIGTIVYVLIIVPVAIAALDQLGIESISGPAIELLETIAGAIPLVIGAALVLGIAFFIARWIADLIEDVLPGLGLDQSVGAIGILPNGMTASSLISKAVTVAIMIFGAIAATKLLNFPELTNILKTVLALGGKVLFGAVIIAAGFFIANILANFASEGSAKIIRYGTVFVFAAMGLSYMEVGGPITQYGPLAIIIGATVAGAIAFGLGGRDAASRVLDNMQGDKPVAKKPAAKKPAAKKK